MYYLKPVCGICVFLTYAVLEDSKFAPNIAARCLPDGNGNFVIEIRESVYSGARRNIGAYLGHICHEICHVFLFKLGYTPITERSFLSSKVGLQRLLISVCDNKIDEIEEVVIQFRIIGNLGFSLLQCRDQAIL